MNTDTKPKKSRRGKPITPSVRVAISEALRVNNTRRNGELARTFRVDWHTVNRIRREMEEGKVIRPFQPRPGRPAKRRAARPIEDRDPDEIVVTVEATFLQAGSSQWPLRRYQGSFGRDALTDNEGLHDLVMNLARDLVLQRRLA